MPRLAATRPFLAFASAALLASLLSACGGGGSDNSSQFYVTAVVSGQNMGNYGTGTGTVYIRSGQYVELDANEPVAWTLLVGNSAVTGTGTTVQYGGAVVTLTAETDSRIAVDTYGTGFLSNPVGITLVATSTYDSAQVATVDVVITN